MTRSEQEMYKNIERIAVALETIVIQGKDQKLNQFKKAANLIYGNDQLKGRSADNYSYPSKGTTNTSERTSLEGFTPDIQSDLDSRIYSESQSCTGGEFDAWHTKLTDTERESYRRVYGH
jgi:hypothetical protein